MDVTELVARVGRPKDNPCSFITFPFHSNLPRIRLKIHEGRLKLSVKRWTLQETMLLTIKILLKSPFISMFRFDFFGRKEATVRATVEAECVFVQGNKSSVRCWQTVCWSALWAFDPHSNRHAPRSSNQDRLRFFPELDLVRVLFFYRVSRSTTEFHGRFCFFFTLRKFTEIPAPLPSFTLFH